MRLPISLVAIAVAVVASAFTVAPFSAPHDPCKVLTAEKFSKIMGFVATVQGTPTNGMSCFYIGPAGSGGQFMILSEAAAGPGADAMLKRKGSSPPAGSGLLGGTYREGSIIFSVSIKSTDSAKLEALVAEIRRNLK